MQNIENIHSKVVKLFKAGVVNLEGRNPLDNSTKDIAYISPQDLPLFAKKFRGTGIYKNGHFDDGAEEHEDEVAGKIGDTWVEGDYALASAILTDEGLRELESGKGLSISYKVLQALQNHQDEKKEGLIYNYRIADLEPDHVAIVESPRYDGAGLKHNSADCLEDKIICEQKISYDKEKFKKSVDNINNAYSLQEGNKPLTKRFDMFGIKKKHNNVQELGGQEATEKKYLSLEGKKVMGMEGTDFMQKLCEAYATKHNNVDLAEDEEALSQLIKIEHEGEEVEISLRDALEYLQGIEKNIQGIEAHENKEISEDKHNGEEVKVEKHDEKKINTAKEEIANVPHIKENKSIKHNSYADIIKKEVSEKAPEDKRYMNSLSMLLADTQDKK